MQHGTPITSAAQATKEAKKLKSCWSRESHLSLRTLIYCAKLLEQMVGRKRPKRKPTAYEPGAAAGSAALQGGKH